MFADTNNRHCPTILVCSCSVGTMRPLDASQVGSIESASGLMDNLNLDIMFSGMHRRQLHLSHLDLASIYDNLLGFAKRRDQE